MRLTQHFTLEEMTFTQHREFDNNPPPEVVERLRTTAQGLERIRTLLGHPIHVNSGYRSPELNRAVGGATNSQHCLGLAVDFICPGFGSPLAVARFLSGRVINLGIDQLIHEFDSWVHVSFSDSPRHVLLSIDRSGTHIGIQ
jgi:hypothetical protein